ncbi:hypothetical protein PCANC_03665 [Puccinia coronata f. sp. avenae]|uniref:Uncharacterized protein n=1 Tax=Puccinia coronata f. sp. avenae TaxID=200324 RepID=A0A2N5VXK9_9BASI|nr:hypothetical protein PCANC_03665 [Puccinia coronata f. sp. avenae]
MTTHTGTTRTKSPRVAWNRHAASLVPYRSQDAADVARPQGDQTVTVSVSELGIRPGVYLDRKISDPNTLRPFTLFSSSSMSCFSSMPCSISASLKEQLLPRKQNASAASRLRRSSVLFISEAIFELGDEPYPAANPSTLSHLKQQ